MKSTRTKFAVSDWRLWRTKTVALVGLLAVAPVSLSFGQASLDQQLTSVKEVNDNPAIIEIASRLLEQRPKDAALFEAITMARIDSGDLERAEKTLAAWTVVDPTSPTIETARGDLLLAQEKTAEAVSAWSKALQSAPDPDKPALLRKIASASDSAGDYKTALKLWTESNAASGEASDLIYAAEAMVELGDFSGAVATAKKASAQAPDNAVVTGALPKFERLAASTQALEKFLKYPASEKANYLVAQAQTGLMLGMLGFPHAALPYAERALAMKSETFTPTLAVGYLLRANGRPEEAADLLVSNSIPTGTPEQIAPRVKLLQNLLADDIAILEGRETAEIWNRQLQRLGALNEPWYGAARAAEAAAKYGGDANLLAMQAFFYLQTNNPGAGEASAAALKLDPKNGMAWWVQGNVLSNAADFEGALKAYRQAAQFSKDSNAASAAEYLELLLQHPPPAVTPLTPPKAPAPKASKLKIK